MESDVRIRPDVAGSSRVVDEPGILSPGHAMVDTLLTYLVAPVYPSPASSRA